MPPADSEIDQRKRKPRENIKPYDRVKVLGKKRGSDAKTSAIKPTRKQHLTLHDWLTVVEFFDSHNLTQDEVVKHFATRTDGDGALIFTQSALSRHLSTRGRKEDQQKLLSTPTALSSKRVRVVTRPDVEKALWLWVKHMEEKSEHVTGPMLVAKRAKFEKEMDVPEAERMKSDGWIGKFCKA